MSVINVLSIFSILIWFTTAFTIGLFGVNAIKLLVTTKRMRKKYKRIGYILIYGVIVQVINLYLFFSLSIC